MGSIFIILFALSVPIFYFIGLIQTLVYFSRRGEKKPTALPATVAAPVDTAATQLEKLVDDLSASVAANPEIKGQEILLAYNQKLVEMRAVSALGEVAIPPAAPSEVNKNVPEATAQSSSVWRQPLNQVWNNWYAANSITLLLYVGAFLVVAAAAIFVGFQWGSLSGEVKAVVLSLVMLVFLVSGLVFYALPRIRQAGATFAAIGAILLPLSGAAWYNFVLAEAGLSFGAVWLGVALLSLVVYLGLYFYFKAGFYVYIASLASISLLLSLVQLGQLPSPAYIAAGITGSILLLLGSALPKLVKPETAFSGMPMELTAQVTMPVFLAYGLWIVVRNDQLFTTETAICLGLSAVFYGACFALIKQSWQWALGLSLLALAVASLTYTLTSSVAATLYALNGLGFAYLVPAFTWRRTIPEASQASAVIGSGLSFAALVLSWPLDLEPTDQFILASLTVVIAVSMAVCSRLWWLHYMGLLSLAIGSYIVFVSLLSLDSQWVWLSMAYAGLGVISYALADWRKTDQSTLQIATVGSAGFFILSLVAAAWSADLWATAASTSILLSVSVMAATRFRQLPELVSVAGAVFYIWAAFMARAFEAPNYAYPLLLSLVSAGVYGCSRLLIDKPAGSRLRQIALVGALGTAIVFFLRSRGSSDASTWELFEWASLLSAYAACALFATDAYVRREIRMGYMASAIGMATYLWQLTTLSISNVQWYTAGLAAYFLVLASTRRALKDKANQQLLDFLGMAFLIFPTIMQARNGENILYTALLLAYGALLISMGISTQTRYYTYVGIGSLAIGALIQVGGYIFSLPQWMLVGIIGLIFLLVAIGLLVSRKEDGPTPLPPS